MPHSKHLCKTIRCNEINIWQDHGKTEDICYVILVLRLKFAQNPSSSWTGHDSRREESTEVKLNVYCPTEMSTIGSPSVSP